MSIWPWSDLVSLVFRYILPFKKNFSVLELGCGAGANIPFFLSLGANYYAIEGSQTIVKKVKKKFPELVNNILIGDFTKDIPFPNKFDLIVDRASVTHNSTNAIIKCLNMVYEKLIDRGKYIGIDWFSTMHSEFINGVMDEDNFTRCDYASGQFSNVGRVHFSDKNHLLELFRRFEVILLQHKNIKTEIPHDGTNFASWNLVVEKK